MPIDTAAKRSSALDHEEVWESGAPIPDGAISQGDRQHALWSYSGILAGAPVVPPPPAPSTGDAAAILFTAGHRAEPLPMPGVDPWPRLFRWLRRVGERPGWALPAAVLAELEREDEELLLL